MLRVLINRYNPKAGNALLKFLPQEQQAAISKSMRSVRMISAHPPPPAKFACKNPLFLDQPLI